MHIFHGAPSITNKSTLSSFFFSHCITRKNHYKFKSRDYYNIVYILSIRDCVLLMRRHESRRRDCISSTIYAIQTMYFYDTIKLSEHKFICVIKRYTYFLYSALRGRLCRNSSSFSFFFFKYDEKLRGMMVIRWYTISYNDKYRLYIMRKRSLPKLFMYKRIT